MLRTKNNNCNDKNNKIIIKVTIIKLKIIVIIKIKL